MVDHSQIIGSHANHNGGAIYVVLGNVAVRNGSSIVDSTALNYDGGALMVADGSMLLADSSILSSTAALFSGKGGVMRVIFGEVTL
eukprot:1810623-Prymnesium_polylepis.1